MCAQGCHATVRIAVGGYSEDRQIDMEALYRDKPNADTIDQVMEPSYCDAGWIGCRLTHSTYLKTRSFRYDGHRVWLGKPGFGCQSARLRLSATLGAQ